MLRIVGTAVHLGHFEVLVNKEQNLPACYHLSALHRFHLLGMDGALEIRRDDVRQGRRQFGIQGCEIVSLFLGKLWQDIVFVSKPIFSSTYIVLTLNFFSLFFTLFLFFLFCSKF